MYIVKNGKPIDISQIKYLHQETPKYIVKRVKALARAVRAVESPDGKNLRRYLKSTVWMRMQSDKYYINVLLRKARHYRRTKLQVGESNGRRVLIGEMYQTSFSDIPFIDPADHTAATSPWMVAHNTKILGQEIADEESCIPIKITRGG